MSMLEYRLVNKKTKYIIITFLWLFPFILVEIVSRFIFHYSYNEKEKKVIAVMLGLAPGYSANMVSYYRPHHYLSYVLNPQSMEYYKDYYGDRPGYAINSHGFRGKNFSIDKLTGVYRIVCMGGSTTFCLTESDESHTYPQMLEDALNSVYSSPSFEVINAGTPSWTSAESFINFHFRVMELKPDMIILYHGLNDTFPMRRDEEGKSDYSNWRKSLDYSSTSDSVRFLIKHSVFFQLIYLGVLDIQPSITSLTVLPRPAETNEDENLEKATGKYFIRNTEAIVSLAKANSIVPVLMTMGHGPWHSSLSLNNQSTRQIAKEKGAILVDFEKIALPHLFSPSDNVHFTRQGNIARVKLLVYSLSRSEVWKDFERNTNGEPSKNVQVEDP